MCERNTLDESQCSVGEDLVRLLYEQNHKLPSLQSLCSGIGNKKITREDLSCNRAHIFPPNREDSVYLPKCASVHVA